jgi:hypothetical protein
VARVEQGGQATRLRPRRNRWRLWLTLRDVPAARIRRVIRFAELSASPLEATA